MRSGTRILLVAMAMVALIAATAWGQCAEQIDTSVDIDFTIQDADVNRVIVEFTVLPAVEVPALPNPTPAFAIGGTTIPVTADDDLLATYFGSFNYYALATNESNGSWKFQFWRPSSDAAITPGEFTFPLALTLPGNPLATNITAVSTTKTGGATVATGATAAPDTCNIRPTIADVTATPDTTLPDLSNIYTVDFALDTPFAGADTPVQSITDYEWNVAGVAGTDDEGTAADFSWAFASDAASYSVTARIKDSAGAWSAGEVIDNQRPAQPFFTVIPGADALSLVFEAYPTDDVGDPLPENPDPVDPDTGDTIFRYWWTIKDGTPANDIVQVGEGEANRIFVLPFTDQDPLTVTLRVQDDRGLWSEPLVIQDIVPDDAPATPPNPPSGLRIQTSGGVDSYYGEAPFSLPLSVTYNDDTAGQGTVYWDLGAGFVSVAADPGGTVSAPTELEMDTPGTKTVSVYAEDPNGYQSPVTQIVIGAYPNEEVAFPQAGGVPRDAGRAPYVDGRLEGDDLQEEPATQWDAGAVYGENGWRGAFGIPFGVGTEPDGQFEFIRDGNELFFGFDIPFDSDLIADDVIFVGIGQNDHARIGEVGGNQLGAGELGGAAALLRLDPSPAAPTVTLYLRDGDGAWGSGMTAPAGIDFKVLGPAEYGNGWSAELKVPLTTDGSWRDLDGRFLLMVALKRAEVSAGNTGFWMQWPRTSPVVMDPTDLNTTADPLWWGIAATDGSVASNGLWFENSWSIGRATSTDMNDPLATSILYGDDFPNQIAVRVSNDARDYVLDSGEPVPDMITAENVRILFKMARWGIAPLGSQAWVAPDFTPGVAATLEGNPTEYVTVAPGQANLVDPDGGGPEEPQWVITPAVTQITSEWILNQDQIDEITAVDDPEDLYDEAHQCMLAEIEVMQPGPASTESPVNVVTRSVARNMDFEPTNDSHAFVRASQIVGPHMEGLPADAELTYLLRVYTREWKVEPREARQAALVYTPHFLVSADDYVAIVDAPPPQDPGKPLPPPIPEPEFPYADETWEYIQDATQTISFIEYIVKGYVFTGNTLHDGDATVAEIEPIGSYGYVVRHEGDTEDWDFEISGAEKINDTTYLLRIGQGEAKIIQDTVDAIEPPRFTLSLTGGAAMPAPAMGGNHRLGFGVILDAGFHMGAEDSLRLQGGYAFMPAETATSPWHSGRLTAVFQHSFTRLNWLRPYLQVGGGVFLSPTGAIRGGAAAGAGIDVAIARAVHLRAGVDFVGSRTEAVLSGEVGLVYRIIEP